MFLTILLSTTLATITLWIVVAAAIVLFSITIKQKGKIQRLENNLISSRDSFTASNSLNEELSKKILEQETKLGSLTNAQARLIREKDELTKLLGECQEKSEKNPPAPSINDLLCGSRKEVAVKTYGRKVVAEVTKGLKYSVAKKAYEKK